MSLDLLYWFSDFITVNKYPRFMGVTVTITFNNIQTLKFMYTVIISIFFITNGYIQLVLKFINLSKASKLLISTYLPISFSLFLIPFLWHITAQFIQVTTIYYLQMTQSENGNHSWPIRTIIEKWTIIL